MRIKSLISIYHIAMVLVALTVIPSCALASENGLPNRMFDMRLGQGGNLTDENFANIQKSMLDSISKQITELQSFYTDVSKASNASELEGVLLNHRPANRCFGVSRVTVRPGHMNRGFFGISAFNLDKVADVTDDNFTDVQKEIVDSLGKTTEMLKDRLNDTKVSQDSNLTAKVNERITDLQNLSTDVSKASTAAELKEVVFKYTQAQAVDSLEKEIENLQTTISNSENTSVNTTELNNRITELTTLKEKISGAKSLEEFNTIISSYRENSGMKIVRCGREEAGLRERSHRRW